MIDEKANAPLNLELNLESLFEDDDLPDEIPEDPFALNFGLSEAMASDLDDQDDDGYDPFEAERSSTPEINEGDYLDPAVHAIFVRLKKHVRDACNVNAKREPRTRALEWIFVPSTRDSMSLEFNPVCIALGGRPSLIRARAQHQLWKANILLTEPLPFLSATMPESIMSEISAQIGPGLPEGLARETWFWPSIPTMELRAKFPKASNQQYQTSLESLMAAGYVAISAGRVYFITRNPTIMSKAARNRFSFAGAVYGD